MPGTVLAVVHRGHVVTAFLMHRVEGQRGQGHRPPGLGFPEIHQHVQPLPWREEGLLDALRPGQQAAVGAGQIETQGLTLLQERQPVTARVAAVEQAKAHDAAPRLEHRALGQVDQQPAAHPAAERLRGAGRVLESPLCIEFLVLQHQRNLGFTQRQRELLAQGDFVLILNKQQAGQPVVGLLGNEAVRMGVVPVHRGPVLHGEGVVHLLTRCHHVEPVAVVARIHAQAVPVNDGGLIDAVDQLDPHLIALSGQQRRVEELLATRFHGVGQDGCALPWQHFDLAADHMDFLEVRRGQHPEEATGARQAQGVGEARRLRFNAKDRVGGQA